MSIILMMIITIMINYHSLTYFQQFHYHCQDYLRYCQRIKYGIMNYAWIAYLLLLFPYDIQVSTFDLSLMIMISIMLQKKPNYRKPLVYTNRAKRIYGINFLIHLIVCSLFLSLSLKGQIILLPFVISILLVTIMIANAILDPIEKIIQNRIKKKAKNKIKKDTFVIAIGGSYGKTSIKNILYELIKEDYYTCKTPYSYNNEMGISKYLLNEYDPNAQVLICEVGIDRKKEMERLMELIDSDLVLLSAIGNQHLANFKNKQELIKEKQKLVNDPRKIRIVCIDYVAIEGIKQFNQVITYGEQISDYQIVKIEYEEDITYFTILNQGKTFDFQTNLVGKHHIYNICASIVVARILNVSWLQLQQQVKCLKQIKHRLELIKYEDYWVLDDAYNANEKGIINACDVLKKRSGQRIMICSGLVEMPDLEKIHYDIGAYMKDCVDEAILLGKYQKQMKQGLIDQGFDDKHIYLCDDIFKAFELCKQIRKHNSTILIENDLCDIHK